jgi:hypothetical protein
MSDAPAFLSISPSVAPGGGGASVALTSLTVARLPSGDVYAGAVNARFQVFPGIPFKAGSYGKNNGLPQSHECHGCGARA